MRRWLVLLVAATMAVASACEAFGSPQLTQAPAIATIAPAATETPSPEPTLAPTTAPATGSKLAANDTIHYTSSTSLGRTIELKVTVRNRGAKAGSKITMEIEGLNFTLKRKTPLVGCIPNCKAATGAEGIAYIVWTAPASGASKTYTAQLKTKARGTFKYEVRVYDGKVGAYGDELGSWTVTSRVR